MLAGITTVSLKLPVKVGHAYQRLARIEIIYQLKLDNY